MFNTEKIDSMLKVARYVLNANTSDEVDNVLASVEAKPEDINYMLDILRHTNTDEFYHKDNNPRYQVNQKIYAPYYSTKTDLLTGTTYRNVSLAAAVITAVSRETYQNQSFFNEFLYTVRYEDGSSRGNLYEHALKTELPAVEYNK